MYFLIPQISPILWTQLLLIMSLNIIIINSISYFETIYKKSKTKKKKNLINWKW